MTQKAEVPMQITLPEAPDTTPEPAPEDKSESGVNWGEISGEMGSGDSDVEAVEGDQEVIEPPAEVTPEPVAAPDEAIAPAPQEPVAPSSPVAAPVTGTVPSHDAQPTPAPPPEPVQPTAAAPAFDLAQWEKEQLTGLEKIYALNEQDAQDLQTQPELILPRLAANMHMVITKSLLTAMQGVMPGQIAQFNQQISADTQARDAFYGANPDLKDHEDAVLRVAQVFRAANPTAPRDTAIKIIGEMTRSSLGLVKVAPTEAAPQAPVSNVKPFSPARGGGGGTVPAKPKNMWAELVEDD